MEDFFYRTEDIKQSELLDFFVETKEDRSLIDSLKSNTPLILEGSRGTGKSFLMRVAEAELKQDFDEARILPVYVSFLESSLLHTGDAQQFKHWMLAKLCSQMLRALRRFNLASPPSEALTLLNANLPFDSSDIKPKIENIADSYEESWADPGKTPDTKGIPQVEDFKESVQEICEEKNVKRICILFDEAAHVFRLAQQRQFFSLFRDLRSPYLSCNAAVYPGVTSYGSAFQLAHDATRRSVERDLLRVDYLEKMREIVVKQADESFVQKIERNEENFSALAYAVNGNPRLLLKTVARCPSMRVFEVESTIREFYRSEIWSEFTAIGDTYEGYRPLVDWGRDFLEKVVLPSTKEKNDSRSEEGRDESTCFFWVHRDAPEEVKKALRLLAYSGIVQKVDDAIRGTRSELGSRYSVNLGCLLSLESQPIRVAKNIIKHLSIKRFTEFGANFSSFNEITGIIELNEDLDTEGILLKQLNSSIDKLDISDKINNRLTEAGITTIRDILSRNEDELVGMIHYVGPVRARTISNSAKAAVLEFLAG